MCKVVLTSPYHQFMHSSHSRSVAREGSSWTFDYILRDDGVDTDLGYPSTVELSDGSLMTLYYQKVGSVREKCSLLTTMWTLPPHL